MIRIIRELGSSDNGTAVRAVMELDAHGWLFDGSLRGAFLVGADLEWANLTFADLRNAQLDVANLELAQLVCAHLLGAQLSNAKLESASLEDSIFKDARLKLAGLINSQDVTGYQLVLANSLLGATMSDDGFYDGRFCLQRT